MQNSAILFDSEDLQSTESTVRVSRQLQLTDTVNKSSGFALARFEQDMSILQRRMLAVALSQIKTGDSVNSSYDVDAHAIAKMLKIAKTSITGNCDEAAETLLNKNQVVYFETPDGWVRSVLIESIARKGKNVFAIKFAPSIMPHLIAMRENYDLSYPLGGPLQFKCKYSHLVYDFFLVEMNKGVTEVVMTPNDIREVCQLREGYERVGHLTSRVVLPLSQEIDKYTQVSIAGQKPEIRYEGRGGSIKDYTFRLSFKANMPIPIRKHAGHQTELVFDDTLPSDEKLDGLMMEIGVAANFRKHVLKYRQPLRVYRNLLYTKIKGNSSPAFFNEAFKKDWAKGMKVSDLEEELKAFDDPEVLAAIARFKATL